MTSPIDSSATGDIAIAIQRRKGDISVPVYVWIDLGSGPAWVDFLSLTGTQFSAWVDQRCAGIDVDPTQPNQPKTPGFTLSRTNNW